MMRRRLITLGIVVAMINAVIGPLMYVLRDGEMRDRLFSVVAYPSIVIATLLFVFMLFDKKTRAAINAYNSSIFGGQMPSRLPTASDVFDENVRFRKAAGFAGVVASLLSVEFILAILISERGLAPPPPLALAAIGTGVICLSLMLDLGERYQGEIPPDPKISAAGWIALAVLAIPAIAVAALLVHFANR
jgi:hypothetical protein